MMLASDIIYIDDDPQQLLVAARAHRAGNRFCEFIYPVLDGVGEAAVAANLWVFDFFNDDANRQILNLAGVNSNGLSVFQELRHLVGDARPPTVLLSNDLEAALGSEINLARRHILAEEVGVEWVSPKVQPSGDVIAELLALANAVAALRENSAQLAAVEPIVYVSTLARYALKLPQNVEWTRAAVRDVAAWRPPIWLGERIDQRPAALRQHFPIQPDLRSVRSVVAWLIRQALPYPSFLVRDWHIAVRLGVPLGTVRAALGAETRLMKRLRHALYKGVLANFDGSRWWSAGVDAIAWELPRQKELRSEALRALIYPIPFAELGFIDPVVVSDAELVETGEIAPAAECVRAADEYFPPHAPPAWIRVEDARHDKVLARKVKLEDQSELATNA